MDLNKLRIFSVVADHQSFTSAAKELGIEKSTVSTKIAELEESLGVRLLHRTTRTVALTEAGESYYQYCQKVVQTAQEADDFVQSLNSEPQGLLRISAPEGIGRILFEDLFRNFLSQYPQINLEIFLSSRHVDLVKERYDIALRVSNSPLTDSTLIGKHIFTFELGIFISCDYAKQYEKLENFEQLSEHLFINLAPSHAIDLLPRAADVFNSEVKNRIIINDIEGVIEAIKAGVGVGILPAEAVKKELEAGSLLRIFPETEFDPVSLYALYPSRKWVSPKLKVLLDFLSEWALKQPVIKK